AARAGRRAAVRPDPTVRRGANVCPAVAAEPPGAPAPAASGGRPGRQAAAASGSPPAAGEAAAAEERAGRQRQEHSRAAASPPLLYRARARRGPPGRRCAVIVPSLALDRSRRLFALAGLLVVCLINGCAAVTNPTVDGIPVRRLPPEVYGKSRENERPIPLTALRQKPPEAHLVGPGDVLGVYVEGVLGDKATPPPGRIPEQ